tara:strand:- start:105 stop:548 length:444 start_codon:yes stop_codon:yes gene_type:complete
MEDNKLIAEFMEFPTHTDAVDDRTIAYYVGESIMHTDNTENENDCDVFHPDDMQFQTSWDWLMPVVEKIERKHKANFRTECLWNEFIECSIYQVIVSIEQGEMSKDKSCIYDSKKIYWYIGDSVKCKREATYKAVVEFIKTYNDGGM